MNTKLFIGTEQADFNEKFNVMFSIGDIRNVDFGNNNKSYTLNLPLTKTNKRLLGFINRPDVRTEVDVTGRLFLGEMLIIQGEVKITDYNETSAKIIINSDDWIDVLKNRRMSDLDLSAHNHTYNSTNIVASWSASYPFYRYPMINFGALFSAEYGATPDWTTNDFIPAFRVLDLMASILSPYTISSSWSALSAIKDLYILANERKAADSFIVSKGFERQVFAITDNSVSSTYTPSETKTMTLTLGNTVFNGGVMDEASAYDDTDDWYLIPETGTYKFTYSAKVFSDTSVVASINSQQMVLAIKRTRGASTDVLVTETTNYSSANIFNNSIHTITTGYAYFEVGDKVFCTRYLTQNLTNNAAESELVTIYMDVTDTKFYAIWDNRNLYNGIGKTIVADDLLPDISQIDFISAIRDIYNLRFWLDKQKQVIYIEPWDSFVGSTVKDLSSYIDYDSIDTELISPSYTKTIRLKFKDDTSDYAYNEWLKTADSPGQKDIVLSSIYTQPGFTTKENLFASIINGINPVIWAYTIHMPRILTADFDDPPIEYKRLINFTPRIVEWKGLTSGITWYLDGVSKSTWPKVQGLDFTDIYASHWLKTLHYIDKGKLFTVRMKIKAGMITEFFTVVNTATSEGFRPTYKINIGGVDNYFLLQKIVTDGIKCELELVLKQ